MSTEFRPRKLSEYARIALKRKWMIILPTLAIGLAISFVVLRLPDLYESSTLIVVKPSTLPNSVVPMITEETLTRELASISQVVTSRSSLQPLVEKYDLYKEEQVRAAKEEVDAIDTQRLTYLQQNMNNLPSQSQALVGRLTALHEEQKALLAEQGRLRDLAAAYRNQLGDISKSYEQEIVLSAENTTDPKTTAAWAQLVSRR